MMDLFDTHAHLLDERFDTDRDELIAALPAAGVRFVMEACCDRAGIGKVRALAARVPFIYGSAGIHPHSADEWCPDAERELLCALADEKIKAIGEIGLDYYYDFSPRETQRKVFDAQLAIAAEKRVPVIIHDREAHGDTMDMLRAYKGKLTGIMHCFSGSYETARESIGMGLYIAFGGALTFKNAANRRDIAARLPLERLLLETDCPYMTPEPFRGQRNDPRMAMRTLEVLASVRTESIDEIALATYRNALVVFGININF